MFSPEIQHIISNYQILGVIPLDKALHFIVGAVLTIILRWMRVSMRTVFIVIGVIAVGKEVNDYFVLNNSYGEQILDIGVTFIYPMLIWGVLKLNKATGRP